MTTVFGLDKPIFGTIAGVVAVVGLGVGFALSGGFGSGDDEVPSGMASLDAEGEEGGSASGPDATVGIDCAVASGAPRLDAAADLDLVGVDEAGAMVLAEVLGVADPLILPEGDSTSPGSIAGHDPDALARIETPRAGAVLVRDGEGQSAFAERAAPGWVVVVVAGPEGRANPVDAQDVLEVRVGSDDRSTWTLDEDAAREVELILRSGAGCSTSTGENG